MSALRVLHPSSRLGSVQAIAHRIRRLEYAFGPEHFDLLPNVREVSLPVRNVPAIRQRALERVHIFENAPGDDNWEGLLEAIPHFGPIAHLSFETGKPITREIVDALAAHGGIGSVELNLANPEAAEAIRRNARAFARIEPQREFFGETAAHNHFAIANAYLEMDNRQSEAIFHFKEAYVLSGGRMAPSPTAITDLAKDADPEYDGAVARVPSLLMLGFVDRVLAAAPNHLGAWAMLGIRALDPAAATEAFSRALGSERLGRAFALQDATGVEPNDPFDALMLRNVLRGRIPPGHLHPLEQVAHGVLEHRQGATEAARKAWDLVLRGDTEEPRAVLARMLAAALVGTDAEPFRRTFRAWIAAHQRIEPQPHLAFEVVLRLVKQVLPDVDVRPVAREIDRLRAGR